MMYHHRGFALIISVIITSVVLAVGIALLDIAYKQVLLSSSSKNSQYAFYNADSALECALFWDQKSNAFDYAAPIPSGTIACNNIPISNYASNPSGSTRTTTFDISCAAGGTSASITVLKQSTGSTDIYANGFSSCNASLNTRIERGLKAHY